MHRIHVMASVTDTIRPAVTEVLVQLELHATSTKRVTASRAP
jgi:hypothetical protein